MLVAPAKVMYYFPFPSSRSASPIAVAACVCVPFALAAVMVRAGAEMPRPIFCTDAFSLACGQCPGEGKSLCPMRCWVRLVFQDYRAVSSQENRFLGCFGK